MTEPTGEALALDSWLHWDEGGGRVGVLAWAQEHMWSPKSRSCGSNNNNIVELPAGTLRAARPTLHLPCLLCHCPHLLRISCACVCVREGRRDDMRDETMVDCNCASRQTSTSTTAMSPHPWVQHPPTSHTEPPLEGSS